MLSLVSYLFPSLYYNNVRTSQSHPLRVYSLPLLSNPNHGKLLFTTDLGKVGSQKNPDLKSTRGLILENTLSSPSSSSSLLNPSSIKNTEYNKECYWYRDINLDIKNLKNDYKVNTIVYLVLPDDEFYNNTIDKSCRKHDVEIYYFPFWKFYTPKTNYKDEIIMSFNILLANLILEGKNVLLCCSKDYGRIPIMIGSCAVILGIPLERFIEEISITSLFMSLGQKNYIQWVEREYNKLPH
jgi:hypothetical protein